MTLHMFPHQYEEYFLCKLSWNMPTLLISYCGQQFLVTRSFSLQKHCQPLRSAIYLGRETNSLWSIFVSFLLCIEWCHFRLTVTFNSNYLENNWFWHTEIERTTQMVQPVDEDTLVTLNRADMQWHANAEQIEPNWKFH